MWQSVWRGELAVQLSFGPIGWLMISEVFPLRLRGRGLSVAVLINFASNALVTFAFSPLEVWSCPALPFYYFAKDCCSALISSARCCYVWNPLAVQVLMIVVCMHGGIGFDWNGVALLWIRGDRSGISHLHILDRPGDEGTHPGGDWSESVVDQSKRMLIRPSFS